MADEEKHHPPHKVNPVIQLDTDEVPVDPYAPDHAPHNWTKEEISFYFDKALAVLNKDNFTTASEYVDLLVNQCLAERHWSDAFTHFLTRVKEMGLEIETDQFKFQELNDKLFYWRSVRMMIHAAGLIQYEDEIMKYEIAKFYQQQLNPIGSLPAPRTRGAPLEPRRKPDPKPKRESILNPPPRPKQPSEPPKPPKPVQPKPAGEGGAST